MHIAHIDIANFRNLEAVGIDLNPGLNIIYGSNGSGKTSFLEAIYHLSLGRSFRTHLSQRVIRNNQESFSVFGIIQDDKATSIKVGVEKSRHSPPKMRLNGADCPSLVPLAYLTPVQLINPSSYRLIEDGPRLRRQFIDWGMFHVEHSFLPLWRRTQRLLKQRNAALRSGASTDEINHWDHEFIRLAERLNNLRQQHLTAFNALFQEQLSGLINELNLTLTFYPGWPKNIDLAESLSSSLDRDRVIGYTQHGPHRADLRFRIASTPAEDVLSRGQMKLVLCALQLTQGILLQNTVGKGCIYLIDDLASELDEAHLATIASVLVNTATQVFITAVTEVDATPWKDLGPAKMFHVEHGQVSLLLDVPRGTSQ